MWNVPRLAGFFSDLDPSLTAQPESFEQEYACYPVSFLGREELEHGNKILLPQSALSILARMNVSWPMVFKISNVTLARETHGGVLEFSAGEGTCFLPYWMMKNLLIREGDLICVKNTSLPKGTYVKLQPVTKDFLEISDHRAVLEYTLRNFAAVTVGDNIVIRHNDRTYEIEIVECLPSRAISIIETDVQVDFAPPKDYIGDSDPTFDSLHETNECKNLKNASEASTVNNKEYSSVTSDASKSLDEQTSVYESVNLKRIEGGVRTYDAEYNELLSQGKLPGIIGKNSRPEQLQYLKSDFVLFGGHGNTLN